MNYNLSLGLKDVRILNFKEVNGQLEVFLEKETSSSNCPNCHTPSTSIKDRKYYRIIDKPLESIAIQLSIKKRCFFCNNPFCSIQSFTEEIEGLPKKSFYTQNFKDFLAGLYQDMDYPTIKKHLTRKYKLELPLSTIHYLLKDLPKEALLLPLELKSPRYLGIDEFSYAKGHCYAVALINLDKKKIIDLVAGGKTTAAAMAVLNSINPSSVEACCIDMWEPFKTACQKKIPNASIVVDKFHLIKHLNECLEGVRKRISLSLEKQDEIYFYQNRFLLLKGKERLSEIQRTKLSSLLSINEELTKVYNLKERFRDLYLIHQSELVYPQLWKWIREAQNSRIPELVEIANSFASQWFTEILNYWHYPISNSITEGKINKIRVIQRKAYHYRNFHNLRYQVLKSEL